MNKKRWNNGAAAKRRRCYYMNKEKAIQDVIESLHNVYSGRFWNRYIRDFQISQACSFGIMISKPSSPVYPDLVM